MSSDGGPEGRDPITAFLRTLEAEGHALEFEAAQAFADAGFDVSQNVGYVSSEKDAAREADVAAYLSIPCGKGIVSVSVAVECKGFRGGFLGVFVASNFRPEPLAATFDIGRHLVGVNVRDEPVSLTFPVTVHGFKVVLKAGKDKGNFNPLWMAIQQALSARDGLAKSRGDDEAVTRAAVLVTDATLLAVRNSASGLVAETIESAAVRVAGALGRPQDTLVIVQRGAVRDFAKRAREAADAYLSNVEPKIRPHFRDRAPQPPLGSPPEADE